MVRRVADRRRKLRGDVRRGCRCAGVARVVDARIRLGRRRPRFPCRYRGEHARVARGGADHRMTARPLLSIVIPSFNQGRYIRETIDSILSQDYRPIEVLVFDGGSTDETVDVLKSYDAPELQWWSGKNRGVVDAGNKGVARARGEIVAIQSSDDTYVPGALSAAVAALLEAPELGLVYGDVEYIDAQSRSGGRTHLPPFALHEYVGKLTYIPQPAAFFTTAAM